METSNDKEEQSRVMILKDRRHTESTPDIGEGSGQ
jgi:hypothetical protein